MSEGVLAGIEQRASSPYAGSTLEVTLESFLQQVEASEDLERARAEFFARTGEFDARDDFYEERLRCFFDWYLIDYRRPDGRAPLMALLDSPGLAEDSRDAAAACLAAHRGLFHVRGLQDGYALLEDRLGGAWFRLPLRGGPALREGDLFDARLVALSRPGGGARFLQAMPGRLFQPAEAHEPLEMLLEDGPASSLGPAAEVLDGLMRMKLRLARFTSIRPRHIYRREALFDREILSAGWARART